MKLLISVKHNNTLLFILTYWRLFSVISVANKLKYTIKYCCV